MKSELCICFNTNLCWCFRQWKFGERKGTERRSLFPLNQCSSHLCKVTINLEARSNSFGFTYYVCCADSSNKPPKISENCVYRQAERNLHEIEWISSRLMILLTRKLNCLLNSLNADTSERMFKLFCLLLNASVCICECCVCEILCTAVTFKPLTSTWTRKIQ